MQSLGHYLRDCLSQLLLITTFYFIFDLNVTGSLITRLGTYVWLNSQWDLNWYTYYKLYKIRGENFRNIKRKHCCKVRSFLALNAFSILKRFLPVIPLDKNKILMFIKLDTKHEIFFFCLHFYTGYTVQKVHCSFKHQYALLELVSKSSIYLMVCY